MAAPICATSFSSQWMNQAVGDIDLQDPPGLGTEPQRQRAAPRPARPSRQPLSSPRRTADAVGALHDFHHHIRRQLLVPDKAPP